MALETPHSFPINGYNTQVEVPLFRGGEWAGNLIVAFDNETLDAINLGDTIEGRVVATATVVKRVWEREADG